LISPTKYTKFPHNIPNSHKIYQIPTKYTKFAQNIPNYHKIYQITTKYTKLPQKYLMAIKYKYQNVLRSCFSQFTKIGSFGMNYIPSGNTAPISFPHHPAMSVVN
jgi:hypothetical protein